jgi:hypothetical protein
MAERNKLSQIADQQMPERRTNFLSQAWDEATGAFARYGRRSGAQRDASLALLNQATAPGTDPLLGAGQKLLGLAGLITHPLAVFPTGDEWRERAANAGNTGRMGQAIAGALGDLPGLLDPQLLAGGGVLAAAPLLGKMSGKVDDVAMNINDFNKMASRGKLRQARSEAQDFDDLMSRKMKANDFEIDDGSMFSEDYEMGDFTKKLKDAGLFVIDDGYGRVVAGVDEAAARALARAKTPAEFGELYGYSPDDVARFYLERRGGDIDQAFSEYVKDRAGK